MTGKSNSKFKIQSLKVITLCIVCVILECGILNTRCFAQNSSSSELITWAKHYDGTMITFEGEIIGDIMIRGHYAWININDGVNAIGVWVDKNLLNTRLMTGGYKSKGSLVEVSGIFSRTCPEHGGDLDIHARTLTVKRDGYAIPEKIDLQKRSFAIASMLVLGAIWVLSLLGRLRAGKKT